MDNSETNIDLIVRSYVGMTALMFACSNGHEEVVQLLMDNSETNIDLIVRRDVGVTA